MSSTLVINGSKADLAKSIEIEEQKDYVIIKFAIIMYVYISCMRVILCSLLD